MNCKNCGYVVKNSKWYYCPKCGRELNNKTTSKEGNTAEEYDYFDIALATIGAIIIVVILAFFGDLLMDKGFAGIFLEMGAETAKALFY